MRVLITNTVSWGSGSFTVTEAIAKELLALGHEVKVFFPDSGMQSADRNDYYNNPLYKIWQFPIKKDGVEIHNFPLLIPDSLLRNPQGLTCKELSDAQFNLYFDELKNQLRQVIEEFKPDAIECQHIWAMNYVVAQLGYPHVTGAHMSDQIGFKYDERMREIAQQGAQRSQYIFAISEYVKQEMLEIYDVSEDKIVVMPNGFDTSVFKPEKTNRQKVLQQLELSIPDDATLITFTGRVSLRKGIDLILEANRLIDPKHNIHFLIFGEGKIEEALNINDLDKYRFDNVHFLGHYSAEMLAQAHNIATLSVAPSRLEGFGIAALEAMACAIPVIVSKDSGPESFAIGDKIEQENPKQLAAAIEKIISMPKDKYKALCELAHETANEFSWTKVAKDRLKYYQHLIDSTK